MILLSTYCKLAFVFAGNNNRKGTIMKKVFAISACSVFLFVSTAAIAAHTDQTKEKELVVKKKAPVLKSDVVATKKNIYQPVDADIQNPTMKNPGEVKYLGSFINMGPESRIQINGFLSAGVSGNTATPGAFRNVGTAGVAHYDQGYVIPERGLVQNKVGFAANSLVGLQFTGNLTSTLSAVAQFVASGSDIDGDDAYQVQTQWAFVRYRPNNNWQFRAGRMRIPLFSYSDTQEIAYTYPWVFLPNTVYRIVPFNNFNGGDVVYSQSIAQSDWLVQLHPFYGANKSTFDTITEGFASGGLCDAALGGTGCSPVQVAFTENAIAGAELTLGNEQIQLHGSYAHASLDGTSSTPYSFTTPALSNDNAYFYSMGLKLAFDWFHFQSEFASRHADKAAGTQGSIANLNGAYYMVGAQLGRWFPNLTYGNLVTTNTGTLLNSNDPFGSSTPVNTNEAPQAEDDWTLGVAYTVNGNVVLKASATRIKPKNGTWGLYNFNPSDKASYMYAASVDAVF
jgi:hypothetical protein